VKPVEQAHRTLSELIRGLIYPIVPVVGVVCVWVYAYAGSMESKLERSMRPHDDDFYVSQQMSERLAAEQRTTPHPVAGIHITSIDDSNKE
jgi:hypothetical protein